MIGLIAIALWGESLFNITHEQFIILRTCLLILAFFSIPTWISASYNQLLVADKQLVYTQKVQCVLSIFKIVLVVMTIVGNLTLVTYYFFFTLILAFYLYLMHINVRRIDLSITLESSFIGLILRSF